MQKYYYEINVSRNGIFFNVEDIASTKKEALALGEKYSKEFLEVQVLRYDIDPSLEENIDANYDVIKEWSQRNLKKYEFYKEENGGLIIANIRNGINLNKIREIFKKNGIEVSMDALRHNFNAWENDYKSGFRDEENQIFLFSPCGCNPLKFYVSPLRDENYTYIA